MNKFIRTEDLVSRSLEYTLLVDDLHTLPSDIEGIFKSMKPDHLTIDISKLGPSDQISIGSAIKEEYRTRCTVYIPASQINRERFEKFRGVSEIEPVEAGFSLHFHGNAPSDLLAQFEVFKRNFSLKEKSYEMEIIESLVEESNRENQKYEILRSKYESLKATQSAGRDRDLEKRYLELMEKYKQSLQRLEKLRQSKLGRLQMAYWRRRGRQG